MFELCENETQLEYCTTYDVYIVQDYQRVKCQIIGLFCVFGYNYRMIDKVPRIGKYGFTRVIHNGCYHGKAGKGWIFE